MKDFLFFIAALIPLVLLIMGVSFASQQFRAARDRFDKLLYITLGLLVLLATLFMEAVIGWEWMGSWRAGINLATPLPILASFCLFDRNKK